MVQIMKVSKQVQIGTLVVNDLIGPVEIIGMRSDLENLSDPEPVDGLKIRLTRKESKHFFIHARLRPQFSDYLLDRYMTLDKMDKFHVQMPLCTFREMYHLPAILMKKDHLATLNQDDQDNVAVLNKVHSLTYGWREQMIDEIMIIGKIKKNYLYL